MAINKPHESLQQNMDTEMKETMVGWRPLWLLSDGCPQEMFNCHHFTEKYLEG